MKPVLLDLYCGAGGATAGYQAAGFYVVGVDKEPQPHYCGDEFVQTDALRFLRETPAYRPDYRMEHFAAVHASPPCQHYANVTSWRGDQNNHPALIAPTRALLMGLAVPWVMENVRTRELRSCFQLCGSMFGLPLRRHRFFETSWHPLELMPRCRHEPTDLAFEHKGERAYADAMGCDWMTTKESRGAIPPAFAEYVGGLLMAHVLGVSRAVA